MKPEDKILLHKMKDKIEGLEKLALELRVLGKGVPAVENNSRDILSSAYILRFAISDVADIDAV